MISVELILYCLASGIAYLLGISLLLNYVHNKLRLLRTMPASLLEDTSTGWFIMTYLMEVLFFVTVPTLGYSFFYVLFPLSGARAGLAVALTAFTLGAVPLLMMLSLRIKLPMPYLLYVLLSHLIKLGGCVAIIGYIYEL